MVENTEDYEDNRDLSINLLGKVIGRSASWDDHEKADFYYDCDIENSVFNERPPEGSDVYIDPWSNEFILMIDNDHPSFDEWLEKAKESTDGTFKIDYGPDGKLTGLHVNLKLNMGYFN